LRFRERIMKFRWITCITLLALLAFPDPGSSGLKAEEAFCPIIARGLFLRQKPHRKITGYLLGGWSKDGWLQDKAAATLLRGGEKYRIFNLSGEAGIAIGSLPFPLGKENEPCHDTLAISFADPLEIKDGLVALGASFNALPRIPKLLSTEQQVYKDAAAAILREKGIAHPQIRLTQVIRVDLEGDGSEEVLVSATYYARGLSPSASPGDYSLVFLRRAVGGKVVTRLIAGDFFPKGLKFGAPGEHWVGAVLDLNGDGVMEIILFGRYYEGDWVAVYRVEGDKIIKTLSAACGV
jgi:hypothetical protein